MVSILECQPRTYRAYHDDGRFCTFRVTVETSDLYVKALKRLDRETERLVRDCRGEIKEAIVRRPEFLTSLSPLDEDPKDSPVVVSMIRAGRKAGTGPMAAVAGAVAEFVGRALLEMSPEIIIENGGDIFAQIRGPLTCGIFAGNSPFSQRLGIRISDSLLPISVCTSSGSVGPSRSFGRADAAVVFSNSASLADAVATAMGNRIGHHRDLREAVEWAMSIKGVKGAVGVLHDHMAALGDLELVPIQSETG
jgi:uncharacterized protein